MTMRITMIQSVMGEAGSLLVAGGTYTVSDGFGRELVLTRKVATDTDNVIPEPQRLGEAQIAAVQALVSDAGNLVVLPTGSATGDEVAIQNALNVIRLLAPGGKVTLIAGRVYNIGARLLIGSRTTLDSTGARINLISSASHMITNWAAYNPALSATDGAVSSGSNVVTTALAASAVVGQTVNIAGAASAGNGPLIGQIASKTSTTVTLVDLNGVTPCNATATVSGAAITITARDTDIRIVGGTWNRGANGPDGGLGPLGRDVAGHSIFMKYVDRLHVDIERAESTAGISFVWPTSVSNFYVRIKSCSVIRTACQVVGPAYSGVIDYIDGYCNDDLVNLCSHVYAEQTDTCGNVSQIQVRMLVGRNCGGSILKLNNGPQLSVSGIEVGTLAGTSKNVLYIGEDTARPETSGGTYGRVVVANISAEPQSAGAQIFLVQPDGLDLEANATSSAIQPILIQGTTAANRVKRVTLGLTLGGNNEYVVRVRENAYVEQLHFKSLTGSSNTASANEAQLVRVNGTAVGTCVVEEISFSEACRFSFPGTLGKIVRIINGTVNKIVANGRWSFATGSGENIGFHVTSGGILGRMVFADGYRQSGGAAMYRIDTGSPAGTVVLGNIEHSGIDRLLQLRVASCEVQVDGVVNGATTSRPIYTNATPQTIRGGGSFVGLTAGSGNALERAASEVVNIFAPAVPVDVTMVARVEGGSCWNTNAAAGTLGTVGPVVCRGTAANSWKRMGDFSLTY